MNNFSKKWQGELRRKLEREAFNEKYECLICRKKENLHIHHLIYVEDKEVFFDQKYWRILCRNCHAKTPKKSEENKILDNPNIIEKDSPYVIICDCCKKEFSSLNPTRVFCADCLRFWIGNWSIYRVLSFDERKFFMDQGSITFDTADDLIAFEQMIEERLEKN